jgi:hypothetical protein
VSPHRDSGIMDDSTPHWARVVIDKLDRLDRHITGGSEPSRGIIVRVDRLEQRGEASAWWTRTAVGAALGAAATAVFGLVKH